MKEMLAELMKKKKKSGDLDPLYKDAKMSVLQDIKDMADSKMKDDMSDLKKVTVASTDKEGLKKGLEKAEEMLGEKDDEHMEEGMPESMDDAEHMEEGDALTDEERAMLEKLMKKAKM